MAQMPANELLTQLAHFTGTTQYYYNRMFPDFRYTDGVKFLAQSAEAYWLLDFIFSNQALQNIAVTPFQVWTIKVVDNEANIEVGDGNGGIVKKFHIRFTDFPLSEFSLYFTDAVLLLRSEY